jgi:hypothetical protein
MNLELLLGINFVLVLGVAALQVYIVRNQRRLDRTLKEQRLLNTAFVRLKAATTRQEIQAALAALPPKLKAECGII